MEAVAVGAWVLPSHAGVEGPVMPSPVLAAGRPAGDRFHFTRPDFGSLWPRFDYVQQARQLSGDRLVASDNTGFPGGFPTGYLALENLVQCLLPGTMLPSDPADLEHLASVLSASQPATHVDLFDLGQEVRDQESQAQQAEAQRDGADSADLPPDPRDASVLPLFVNAFSYMQNGRDVDVASVAVSQEGDELSASCHSGGDPMDASCLSVLCHPTYEYEVVVQWEDGSTATEACEVDAASGLSLCVDQPL